jgi:drug/metabolite transporter (DMT)-like permease
VLAGAAVYSLQIVLMERYAPRYDALAFTLGEMAAAASGLLVVAIARGDLAVPHGRKVWAALLVTGIFASALGFLVQTWAQRRTSATRTALAFTMEPVFTAFFGFTLNGDRLGLIGWTGSAAIMGGILLAEPAAASALVGAVARRR